MSTQHLVLVGVLHQGVHAPAGGVAGGLVAGDGQQQHEELELRVRQLVAVDLGVDQLRDDVIARVDLAQLRELVDVHVELGHRGHVVFGAAVLGVVDPDHAVGPLEEQLAVFLRHAHDLGDRLQRQLGREIGDEIAGAALDDLVDDQRGAVGQVLLQQSDHARGEALVDQLAVAGVLGRIGDQQHDAAQVALLLGQLVGVVETDDALLLRGEERAVAVDPADVGVGDDVPEAPAVGQLVPRDRLFLAQPAEHLVMLAALETIKVCQVDARCLHERPPQSARDYGAIWGGYNANGNGV